MDSRSQLNRRIEYCKIICRSTRCELCTSLLDLAATAHIRPVKCVGGDKFNSHTCQSGLDVQTAMYYHG